LFQKQELGKKFDILDQDHDGEISIDELKVAASKILKKNISSEEANEWLKLLDSDKDGKVTVVELLGYIQERKNKSEIEELEVYFLFFIILCFYLCVAFFY
jgi:Ca2+-binding EF-hand superfamily protein